jgi:flagellar secretion chaperone FliS
VSADAYLESQVLTATPQKLRLLLIGGAIRFAHAAAQLWKEERDAEALEAVIRCRAIVTELLTVVRRGEFEPAEDVIALYVHLFQELTLAQSRRDAEKLRDVIRVLEEERETWRLVCEQLPEAPTPLLEHKPQEITHADGPAEASPMRLSLDA